MDLCFFSYITVVEKSFWTPLKFYPIMIDPNGQESLGLEEEPDALKWEQMFAVSLQLTIQFPLKWYNLDYVY